MMFQCHIPAIMESGAVELHVGGPSSDNQAAVVDAWHRFALSLEDRGIAPTSVRIVRFDQLSGPEVAGISGFLGVEGSWPTDVEEPTR